MVEFMAGAGIPEAEMVHLVRDPASNKPIDPKTLRKHFRIELDAGHTKADTLVAQSLFKNATTATKAFPGGIPLAQIFWLKTRARWRTVDRDPPEVPMAPITPEMDDKEAARRLAFILARGAAEPVNATPAKKRKQPA